MNRQTHNQGKADTVCTCSCVYVNRDSLKDTQPPHTVYYCLSLSWQEIGKRRNTQFLLMLSVQFSLSTVFIRDWLYHKVLSLFSAFGSIFRLLLFHLVHLNRCKCRGGKAILTPPWRVECDTLERESARGRSSYRPSSSHMELDDIK